MQPISHPLSSVVPGGAPGFAPGITHQSTPYGRVGGVFVAEDPHMREIAALARRVARTNTPVLVLGESGVGKEVLARYIHDESNRAGKPFVKVNCAAMPHELLESEMFGHERGSFTGAHQRREGKFETADGGTLLLDEIGEMSPPLQAKLLHVLEDFSFTRVGGNHPVRVDTRIISTTNKPLEKAIDDQEFRKDLYFRLKVIYFRIPPLRERRADIPVLCEHFLRTCSEGRDQAVARLPERMTKAFLDYSWPGNVRELKHLIQRYLILPDEEMILSELVEDEELAPRTSGGELEIRLDTGELGPGKISLKPIAAKAAEEAEKAVILRLLEESHWNRRQAAARLDICYKTLLNKLHQWEYKGHGGLAGGTARALAGGGNGRAAAQG